MSKYFNAGTTYDVASGDTSDQTDINTLVDAVDAAFTLVAADYADFAALAKTVSASAPVSVDLTLNDYDVSLENDNGDEVTLIDRGTVGTNSDTRVPTQKAVKTYADLMLPLTGGTMSGEIAMGTSKITGAGDPTLAQDVATKAYADLMLPLAGGTMSGDIAIGANLIKYDGTGFASAALSSNQWTLYSSTTDYTYGTASGITSNYDDLSTGKGLRLLDSAVEKGSFKADSSGNVIIDAANSVIKMGTCTVSDVVDPTAAQDAATKNYVDTESRAIPPSGVSVTGNVYGLTLSNDTDTDHDINITAGACMDSTNTHNMQLATETTKQIDAAYAAGDDAGGMFTGSVAASTLYHVFLIRKDSDGSIDAGFDISATGANVPAGHTYFRWIGFVVTDGSSNVYQFIHNHNAIVFDDDYQTNVSHNAASWTSKDLSSWMPAGKVTYAKIGGIVGAGADVLRLSTSGTEAEIAFASSTAPFDWTSNEVSILMNTDATIYAYVDGATVTTFYIKEVQIIR